jgi:hypothetical protein
MGGTALPAVGFDTPSSDLPWPPPASAKPERVRPELQVLERRFFPGQAPAMLASGVGVLGAAFVDQALLASPLDDAGRLEELNAGSPPAAGGPEGGEPFPASDPDTMARDPAAWFGTDGHPGTAAASSGTPADVEAGSAAAPAGAAATASDANSLGWSPVLFVDPLGDPLQNDWTAEGGGPKSPPRSSDSLPSNPRSADGGGSGGSAPAAFGTNAAAPPAADGGSSALLVPPLGATPASPAPARPSQPAPSTTPAPAAPAPAPPPQPATPPPAPAAPQGPQPADDSGSGGGGGPLLNTRITLPPHLPLSFEANAGQRNSTVQFSRRDKGHDLFLTSTEMVISLSQPAAPARSDGSRASAGEQWVVRMALVGANPSARLTGLGQQPQVVNYFIGNDPRQWHTNVPVYSEVSYHSVYPGIDLLYYGNAQQQLEYDFTVNPGASPVAIQLAFSGAQMLSINEFGDLVAHTPFGDVVEHAPFAYQMVQGAPQAVTCRYVAPDPAHVGFQLGGYDPTLPLVIDPALVYSTYLGGAGADQGTAITVDSPTDPTMTDAYVTGSTLSMDLPAASGHLFGPTAAYDAFITRIAPNGSGAPPVVVYTDYLGGSSSNDASAIAVDSADNVTWQGRPVLRISRRRQEHCGRLSGEAKRHSSPSLGQTERR